MKRRRVSAAFVELDSAELIRAMDEEATLSEPRVLASSRNQNRRSPRIAGATAEVNIMLGKRSSKKGLKGTSGGQHMSFNASEMDDSSHLADIATKPRDMEHAMSTSSHTTETCGGTSLVTSNLVAKEDKRRSTTEYKSISNVKLQPPLRTMVNRSGSASSNPQDDPSQTYHSEVVSATNLTSATSQLEALDREPGSTGLGMQEYSIPFRPRRSTRKTHTLQTKADLDRSEADEDSLNRGEVSIWSADSEHSNPPNQKGKRRRRVSKPHTASGTCRTSARKQARKYKNSGHAINQLPFTADPMDSLQFEPPESYAALHLSVVGSNLPDVNDGTHIPDITLPDIEKQQPSRTDVFTNNQTLVDISSCSPPAFDQTMPDAGVKRPPDQHSLMWDGRGKAVGKKLTHAFRGSKKTTRNHQALGNGAHSTQTSGMTPNSPNPPITTVLQESSPGITRSQLLRGPKIGVEQVQIASSNACGEPAGPEPSRLAIDAEMLSQRRDALLDTANPANPQSPPSRARLNSKESTGHETGRDGAIECDKMPEDDPKRPSSSDSPANMADTPLANDRKEPDPQIFGGETAVSSQISVVSEDHHIEASLCPGDRSEQTPDSQRPLLAAGSRASVSRSTRRDCAVDHNGSPRLMPQVVTNAGQIQSQLEMGRIRSMIRISDSSSIYSHSSDGSLEEYLPEHQPVARPVWSKFQRDMFNEYGIEAEDLIQKKTKPFPFSGKTDNDVYGKALEGPQKLESRPVKSPTHMNRATPRETNMQSVIQERSLGVPRSGSQPNIDSPRLLSDQRIDATVQGDTEGMEWVSALKTAQQTAHDRLLETNQHLSTQLATEQESIREVLQIFRRGCNLMLQELFRAQEVRMELYQKQMASVKEQHTEICQDLIRGLQELDCRVQQGSESRGVQVPSYPIFPTL